MNVLNVKSEIGRLKKVLLHEPGLELENLTPTYLEGLLFDDIPWLPLAIEEHKAFAKTLKDNGVEVVYLSDLVTESLSDKKIKEQFIHQFVKEANTSSLNISSIIVDYLKNIKDTKEMVLRTMAGIKKTDIPPFEAKTLTDYIRDYPFITDPMPNLYFTRDPFSIIDFGVSINKMYSVTRCRETIYGEYIFKYHPIYGSNEIIHYYNRTASVNIEGGDILVLSDKVVAVGISQRTHPAAVEQLAKNILYDDTNTHEVVLAFDLPKSRSFMHLDTIFTQVDYNKFAIHSGCINSIKVYELTKSKSNNKKLAIRPINKNLESVLEDYLHEKITLIPCGGNDVISSDREQWSDGANTLAIAPGEVIVYQRNHITNEILKENGIKVNVIPSSELSRGRGGPRCMCMPLYRENLDKHENK